MGINPVAGGYMNWITTRKISRDEFLFFIALGVYISEQIFEYTAYGYAAREAGGPILLLLKLIRYGCYFICCLKILISSYHQKYFLIELSALILCFIVAVFAEKQLLFWFLFIWASQGTNRDTLIRLVISLQVFWLVLMLTLSFTGVVENYSRFTDGRMRYFLGFGWTTTAPILFLFVVWQYFYLKSGHMKVHQGLGILLIGTVLYWFTRTRMAYFMLCITICVFFVFNLHVFKTFFESLRRTPLRQLFVVIPWLCTLVSCVAVYFYGQNIPIMEKLDALLSNRLEMGYQGFENFGVTLFGQYIKWVGFSLAETEGVYNYVDNSYLNILFNWGLLVLLVILFVYSLILYNACKENNISLMLIITFICIFSLTEPRLLNLMYNPFLFFILADDKSKVKHAGVLYQTFGRTRNETEADISEI